MTHQDQDAAGRKRQKIAKAYGEKRNAIEKRGE
jgi:hypothetical protein